MGLPTDELLAHAMRYQSSLCRSQIYQKIVLHAVKIAKYTKGFK